MGKIFCPLYLHEFVSPFCAKSILSNARLNIRNSGLKIRKLSCFSQSKLYKGSGISGESKCGSKDLIVITDGENSSKKGEMRSISNRFERFYIEIESFIQLLRRV